MRELVYCISVTIDGRIAGPGGEYEFFPLGDEEQAAAYSEWSQTHYPDILPTHVRAALGVGEAPNRHFDTVVMGRGAYQPALDAGVTSPYGHLRQYVVSSTLEAGLDPAVTVVDGDPVALVRELKQQEGKDIWLCGGGRLAGALLGEIDRMVVRTYPVVAGAGIPVFDGEFDPTLFTVEDRRSFANGVTVTWFARR